MKLLKSKYERQLREANKALEQIKLLSLEEYRYWLKLRSQAINKLKFL